MRSRTVVRLLLVAALWPALARAQTPPPAGTIAYYHVDALGSVRAVTDASGAVVLRGAVLRQPHGAVYDGGSSAELRGAAQSRTVEPLRLCG